MNIVEIAEKKGYTKEWMKKRWDVKDRQMLNIVKNPKQWQIDYVNWMPDKSGKAKGVSDENNKPIRA